MGKKLVKPQPKRQPTDKEIASFVQGGTGQDTIRLTVDLPQDMHRRFKAACAMAGTKMNDEIRRFVERRLAELAR